MGTPATWRTLCSRLADKEEFRIGHRGITIESVSREEYCRALSEAANKCDWQAARIRELESIQKDRIPVAVDLQDRVSKLEHALTIAETVVSCGGFLNPKSSTEEWDIFDCACNMYGSLKSPLGQKSKTK